MGNFDTDDDLLRRFGCSTTNVMRLSGEGTAGSDWSEDVDWEADIVAVAVGLLVETAAA